MLCTSCIPDAYEIFFRNDSDEEIFVILNYHPKEGITSTHRDELFVGPKQTERLSSQYHVKDSLHLYIMDPKYIPRQSNLLTKEQILNLPKDAYLVRMTLTKKDYLYGVGFVYPPTSDCKTVIYY